MIILSVAISLMTACDREARLLVISGATMGTGYSIKTVGEGPARSELQPKIDAELQRLNAVFSTYEATSELSRFNRHPVFEPAAVSSDLMAVLRISAEVHQLSHGAFDVTIAPLVNLWGFGPGGSSRDALPAEADIQALLNSIGFDGIALGVDTATRRKPVTLDLSAVAKGYAVDSIARLLEAEGVRNYLVEIGGELRAKGSNLQGEDWVLAIEKPLTSSRGVFRTLPIRDLGVATSGNYRNFFEVDGVRYSHTIDPATGWPVKGGLVSVSVLHDSAAWADALATTFIVLGIEKSLELAAANDWMFLAILKHRAPLSEGSTEHPEGELITILSDAMKGYLEGMPE